MPKIFKTNMRGMISLIFIGGVLVVSFQNCGQGDSSSSIATQQELDWYLDEDIKQMQEQQQAMIEAQVMAQSSQSNETSSCPTKLNEKKVIDELRVNWGLANDKVFYSCNINGDVMQIFVENNSNFRAGATLPESIGMLLDLEYLHIGNSQLTGSIPTSLSSLSSLKSLFLGQALFTGSIPATLGNLSKLEVLVLANTQLTGSIPATLGNLNHLKMLVLGSARLTGSIPATLGNLSNLKTLGLSYNQLTGSIPTTLGNLNRLEALYLHNNQLTGSIPPILGNLSKLISLTLSNNQLTGNIPATLTNLNHLEALLLSNNQLTGNISHDLANLPNLRYNLNLVNFSYNKFCPPFPGRIPASSLIGNDASACNNVQINFGCGQPPNYGCNQTVLCYARTNANPLALTGCSANLNANINNDNCHSLEGRPGWTRYYENGVHKGYDYSYYHNVGGNIALQMWGRHTDGTTEVSSPIFTLTLGSCQ